MLRATFLFFLLLLFPCSAFAVTNRHSAADGTIQTAIDAAKPGDVILLEPGHYKERLVLRPGIILMGTARDAVIIDGQGRAPVVTLQQDSQLLTLQVTGGGAFDQAVFDRHHASRGEQLADAGAAGLLSAAVEVSATALVRGCSVHDNGGSGIAVSGTNNQSVIENNTSYRNLGGGIGISGGATAVIRGNVCSENLRAGIGCRGSAPRLDANHCHHNVRAGIGIREGAAPVVRDNNCHDNRRAGIGVRMLGTSPLLLENHCHRNGMAGIGSRDHAAPVLFGNQCISNRLAGIGAMEGARVVAIGNQLRGNEAAAVGLQACKDGRVYLEDNDIEPKTLVAIGLQSGWSLLAVSNRFERLRGMPPLVMVFEGAKAEFHGNSFTSQGIAAIRCAGEVTIVGNQFINAAGPAAQKRPVRKAVWALPGSELILGPGNQTQGWALPDVELVAPIRRDPAWEKIVDQARDRIASESSAR